MRINRAPSGECQKCGVWHAALQEHHIKPITEGGEHDLSNIEWLCYRCHVGETTEAMQRRWREDPEYRASIRERNRKARENAPGFGGRKHSPESKERMRQAKLGKKRGPRSEEDRRKISEGQRRHYEKSRQVKA